MDLIRVGEKLISLEKIQEAIKKILRLRCQGLSQQEVAKEIGIDRTFISRLENLGEVRKGKKIALIGFPIKNKEEIEAMARERGVDLVYLLNDRERWTFLEDNSGLDIFNQIMNLMLKLKDYEVIIFLGSNMRIRLMEAIIGREVLGIEIGQSPISEDKLVDVELVARVIDELKIKQEVNSNEEDS